MDRTRLADAQEELAAFGTVQSEVVNVTSREEVENLVGQAKAAFGRIDALANNAGIARFGEFLGITDKDWNDTLAINLTGVFLCFQVAAREMKNHESGVIVNMASTGAAPFARPGITFEEDMEP